MNKHDNRNDWQYVGVEMPQQFFDYLTLLALRHNVSKQSIVLEQIKNKIDAGPSKEQLLNSIVNQIKDEWNQSLKKHIGFYKWYARRDKQDRLDEFLRDKRLLLHRKKYKVPESVIDYIIAKARELCEGQIN